ncbi:MAG: hypothetical protein RLZZ275_279 [Bacteroidota bacterium]
MRRSRENSNFNPNTLRSLPTQGDGAAGSMDGKGAAAGCYVGDDNGLARTYPHFDEGEDGVRDVDALEDAPIEWSEVGQAAQRHGAKVGVVRG